MANLQGFDANQVEPSDDLEPIPDGKYVAVITDSEMKPTKAGTGNYLQLDVSDRGGRVRKPSALGATQPRQPQRDRGGHRPSGVVRDLPIRRRLGALGFDRPAQPAVPADGEVEASKRHRRVAKRSEGLRQGRRDRRTKAGLASQWHGRPLEAIAAASV